MKNLYFLPVIMLSSLLSFAHNHETEGNRIYGSSISDTIDIIHNEIHLNIDVDSEHLIGKSVIDFKTLVDGVQSFNIALKGMDVDSIKYNGSLINHSSYLDRVKMDFGSALAKGDHEVEFHYSGSSTRDPLDPDGWGGFWWSNWVAFNVGVAFKDSSHSYGRTLMPCFDNFVEKSTYEFYITSDKDYMASGPGLLIDTMSTDSTKTWHWKNTIPISSYLVGIAVGELAKKTWVYQGEERPLTVEIYGRPSDTIHFKNSFAHLNDMIRIYEDLFGPYKFEKIGYSCLPFYGGAMEHVGNVTLPDSYAKAGLTHENTIAHELSHMWFGNYVTTSNPEEMYINEGFAKYCEALFLEHLYGREDYINELKYNQSIVVKRAHTTDGDYYALAKIPHDVTYGLHTYYKGSLMLHSLRAYVNDDDAFFGSLRAFLDKYATGVANTDDLESTMSDYTGKDLSVFFDPWVKGTGFVDVTIRKVTITEDPSGKYFVQTKVDQQLEHAEELYVNLPISLTFFDDDWVAHTVRFELEGGCGVYEKLLDFSPVLVVANYDFLISDGVLRSTEVVTSTGFKTFSNEMFKFRVDVIEDSMMINVEMHGAQPATKTSQLPSGVYMASSKFWKIDGIDVAGLEGFFQFDYDNRTGGVHGSIDAEWLTADEDQIVLLYRVDGESDWTVVSDAYLTNGSTTDGTGSMRTVDYNYGEYTFGLKENHNHPLNDYIDHQTCESLLINEFNFQDEMLVYPNPSVGQLVKVQMNEPVEVIELISMDGKLIKRVDANDNIVELKLPAIEGVMILKAISGSFSRETTIIQHL